MSALVGALRQIGHDLIEKRLWPIAVLLLAALVATPMLIGGSAEDAASPGAVAAAGPGPAATTPSPAAGGSTSAKATAAKADRGARIDDPFFDPPSPKAEGAGSTKAAGSGAGSARAEASSPTGEAAPRPGTTSTSTSTKTTPATATTTTAKRRPTTTAPTPGTTTAPTPRAPALTSMRTAVRVNGNGGAWPRPMARLTPVGGARSPAALFLGVTTAGATRYAVFVLGAGATSRGEGSCKGATNCRMIGLKAGQTQVVTVRRRDGGERRFTLNVKSIKAVWASAARARAARAGVHEDGRRALSALRRHSATAAALRTARYDGRTGLLRPAAARAVKNASE